MTWRSVKHFARDMLRDDRLLLRPRLDLISADDRATRLILFREGCWQVELVVFRPGAIVPAHRHDRVESLELGVADSGGWIRIGNRRGEHRALRGPLAANLVPLGKGVKHEGAAGPKGSAFLSFQKWDGEPGFIHEDWTPC